MGRAALLRWAGLALVWVVFVCPSNVWSQTEAAGAQLSGMTVEEYESLARQRLHEGLLGEAREFLDPGLSLYPESAVLWDLEAELAIKTGDVSSALIAAKMAHKLEPQNIRAARIGQVYLLGKHDPETALKYLKQGQGAGAQEPMVYYFLARCYEELEETEKAIAFSERFASASTDESRVTEAREMIARLRRAPTPAAPSGGGGSSSGGRARPAQPSGSPGWDCCWQIWGTGCNLGWATALLRYTRERTRWEPADEGIDGLLVAAARHVQTSYSVCSELTPAWPDWSSRSMLLERNRSSLRSKPDPTTREQVYQAINGTRLWGSALNVQAAVVNGRTEVIGHRPTCAEKYFELGFHLSHAQQTLKIADEWLQAGRTDFGPLVVEAKYQLRRCLDLLDAYGLITTGHCVDLQPLDLQRRIGAVLAKHDFRQDGARMIIDVDRVHRDVQQRLESRCPAGGDHGAAEEPVAAEDHGVVEDLPPEPLLVFSFRDIKYSPWAHGGGHTWGNIYLSNNGEEGIRLTERYDCSENHFVCGKPSAVERQIAGKKVCFQCKTQPQAFFYKKNISTIDIGPGETEKISRFDVEAFGEYQFSDSHKYHRYRIQYDNGEQAFIESPVIDTDAFYDSFGSMEDGQPARFRILPR